MYPVRGEVRLGDCTLIGGLSELPENAGKLCIDRLRCFVRPDADQPFKPCKHGKRAGVGVALGGREELVGARVIAVFDQLFGQIDADPGTERLGCRCELEGTAEEASRGRSVGSLGCAPAGGV
ncbi:MAG: hypothetical protein ABSG43_27560 [Solirubrobacteraceae bacterium]|jgi:hypothetical protein